MKNSIDAISRRKFLQLSASLGMLAGLGDLDLALAATPQQDYKALVCLFMLGGNDGHNMVVPLESAQYAAYQAARGALTLPPNQLLPISDATQGQFALHYALPELQSLYAQGRMAILANVGMLVRPTSYSEFLASYQLPTNLRSHSDQIAQMQTGIPNSSGSTGWGGRAVDAVASANSGTSFPVSISIGGAALYCVGNNSPPINLQPGNYLDQNAFNLWPQSAADARANAQSQIINGASGNSIIDAANKVMRDARALNPLLKSATGGTALTTVFPSTSIGNQLKEIARIINLRTQLGVGRQVFFCSLGSFDTHGGQAYQQWDLLQQVSKALAAFHAATLEMGISDKVTSFTLSDFGRTLQPSGSGSDHGWGNHQLVIGGAVNGGRIFGRFPKMTNYTNFNASAEDYADNRGVMLPEASLSQYGATLAQWFGAADSQLDGLFPTLPAFSVRNLGFMA